MFVFDIRLNEKRMFEWLGWECEIINQTTTTTITAKEKKKKIVVRQGKKPKRNMREEWTKNLTEKNQNESNIIPEYFGL